MSSRLDRSGMHRALPRAGLPDAVTGQEILIVQATPAAIVALGCILVLGGTLFSGCGTAEESVTGPVPTTVDVDEAEPDPRQLRDACVEDPNDLASCQKWVILGDRADPEMASRLAALSADAPEAWVPRYAMGLLNHYVGKRDAATREYTAAAELAHTASDYLGEGTALYALATLVLRSPDTREISIRLERALEPARASGDAVLLSRVSRKLSERYHDDGRYSDELALLDSLVGIAKQGAGELPLCDAVYRRGECRRRLGRRREARADYEWAATLARETENAYIESSATMVLGLIALETGDIRALSRFEEAREIAEAAGNTELVAHTDLLAGFALLRRGEISAAKKRLAAGLSMTESTDLRFKNLIYLAEAERRLGELDRAEKRYEEILGLADEVDAREEMRDAWVGLALLHRERGRRDEAIEAARRAESMIEDLRDAIPVLAERSYLLERRSETYQVLAASLAERNPDDLEEPFAVLERAHARTLRETLRETEGLGPRATTLELEDVRGLLAEGDLLLEYLLGEEESSLIAVDATSANYHRLPARRELEALAERFHEALVRPLTSVDARIDPQRDFERFGSEIRSLGESLLGPVASQLRQARRLIVVPDRRLYLVPFEALPAGPGFLGASRAVIYLPAASMLALAPERTSASGKVVVVNADDGSKRSGLAPLRHAGEETSRVLASYADDRAILLSGADASLERLAEATRVPVDVLHLTSHAVLDPELGPRVLLAGGAEGSPAALDVESLNRLPTSPRLAVLSACETARGELVGGEGVLGLVRALTLRGTPQILASLWTVDDELSAEMMGRFHQSLSAGLPPAQAMLKARRAMLADGFVHPFYWSGFVLYGADPVSPQ
jgi:CHAT domain-containing protein